MLPVGALRATDDWVKGGKVVPRRAVLPTIE